MITTQSKRGKGRLAVLCAICFLVFAIFLGATNSVTADGVAQSLTNVFTDVSTADYSSERSNGQSAVLTPSHVHSLHSGRTWQIAQVDEVFTDIPLTASTAYAPMRSTGQQTYLTAADNMEALYIGRGVAMIPTYGSLHRGRSWEAPQF